MSELILHGRPVRTVFDLLGSKENDITYSIGWALARCDGFCAALLESICGVPATNAASALVSLQQHSALGGYTDIEIETADAHLIIEAKRGWNLPDESQLQKYVQRFQKRKTRPFLTVMAECTPEYATTKLPSEIGGIPLVYRSWRQVAQIAEQTAKTSPNKQKSTLWELRVYLEGLMQMQNQQSNLAYVVVLGGGYPPESQISWREMVYNYHCYFHPVGGGKSSWPKEPPNYLAFRYNGQLQSIHHIESYEVVDDLSPRLAERTGKSSGNYSVEPRFLYRLGPAVKPPHTVKNGKIFANGRYRVAIDLLLTCETIAEARDKTKQRLGFTGQPLEESEEEE